MDPSTSTPATRERLTVLVLGTTAQAVARSRMVLEERAEVAVTSAIAGPGRGEELIAQHEPDLAVVTLDDVTDRALDAIEALHRVAPMTTILVLSTDAAPETALRALSAGAGEYLRLPAPPGALAKVLDKVAAVKRLAAAAGRQRGHLWTVVGPKEGVGATTLVANLGVELCMTLGRSVVLVDLDLERAELALVLNVSPPASLLQIVGAAQRLDPVFLEAALARHPSGPYVLAAPLDPPPVAPRLPSASLLAILDLLRARHDVVIVDAPPPLTEMACAAARASDRVLLPTELTVPCLRAAWRTIERLGSLGIPPASLEVIASRYSMSNPSLPLAQARRTLKVPFTHLLPRDDTADAAVNRGLPLADLDEASPLRRAIVKLAYDLIVDQAETQIQSRSGAFCDQPQAS